MRLSVIIPVYNEETIIRELVDRGFAVNLRGGEREILVANAGSPDVSGFVIEERAKARSVSAFYFVRQRHENGRWQAWMGFVATAMAVGSFSRFYSDNYFVFILRAMGIASLMILARLVYNAARWVSR